MEAFTLLKKDIKDSSAVFPMDENFYNFKAIRMCIYIKEKNMSHYTVLRDIENYMVGVNKHTVYRSLLLYFGSGNVALFGGFKSPAGSECC